MSSIRPLYDNVVIRISEEAETTSAGGIVLAGAQPERPTQGEVVAVGPGKALDNGETRAMSMSVGDTVIFGKFKGSEIEVNDETCLVMSEEDVLAVVEA